MNLTSLFRPLLNRIATLVPFTYLDDLVSSGILLAFTMTDVSVILVRQTSPAEDGCFTLETKLMAFNISSFVASLLLRGCYSNTGTSGVVKILSAISCAGTAFIGYKIQNHCRWEKKPQSRDVFLSPFVPMLPLVGCFVNLYLIAQLEMSGLLATFGYVGTFVSLYFYHVHKRSKRRFETIKAISLH